MLTIIKYIKFLPLATILLVLPVFGQSSAEDDFKLARNLYKDAHDYATASTLFAEFIRNYPNDPQLAEARLLLARSYRNSDRCALAAPAYEAFFLEHPEHLATADARRERAACLSELGQYVPAARAYEQVQRRFSASDFAAQALINAAANYTYGQDIQRAVDIYQRVLDDYATTTAAHQARYQLARLLFASGQADGAQRLLVQISTTQPSPTLASSALLLNGRIDLFLGNRDGAEKKFAELHKRFTRSAQADSAYLDYALHLYEQRLFSQAGDAFDRAHKKVQDAQLKGRTLLGLADARRQSHQTREALNHYQTLLASLEPGHESYLRARLGQAIALGQAGQFAQAVGHFQGLIQIGDAAEAREALRELGALYRTRGDQSRAITWYRRYLQEADAEKNDADAVRVVLAELYASTGYREEAVSIYRQLAAGQGGVAAEAQYGLAKTFEAGDQPREALREYIAYLELFPAAPHAEEARQRIEYLREFTVMNPAELSRALQQAWIDELSGTPRQIVQLDVAHALFEHHDFVSAARSFEHYAAAYANGSYGPEAQFFLAESLLQLARQRRIEDQATHADSLRELALQEYRILAHAKGSSWAQRAQLRLIETEAKSGPDSLRLLTLEEGFSNFVNTYSREGSEHLDRALLQLADARRLLGTSEKTKLETAIADYGRLRRLFPQSPLAPQALFGLGLCLAQRGDHAAAADSLERVLQGYPDSPLTASILFEIGQIRLAQALPQEAIARLQELRWGHPAFPARRAALLLLADTYFSLGEHGVAAELYRPLAEAQNVSDPGGRVRRQLARSYHHMGQYGAALQVYRQLLDAEPNTTARDSIYFDQAVLMVRLRQEDEAVRQFLQVRDEFPQSPLANEAVARAGHIAFALENYTDAQRIYQPLLEKSGQDSLVYGQYALALFRLQRIDEGRKAAKRYAKHLGKDTAWDQRFLLEEGKYYQRNKNYEKALKAFRNVEKKGGTEAGEGAYREAVTLWEQNAAAPSEEGAARALETLAHFVQKYPANPQRADAYLRLANYQFTLHNYLQAAGAYKRTLDTPNVDIELAREAIWKLLQSYQGAHEYEAAHQIAEQLLRDFSDHPRTLEARLELGVILKEKGQYAQAINHFEALLAQQRLDANDASEARFYVGESYQNMGEYRKAIEAYYKVSYHGAGGFSQWITSADFQRAKCHESMGEYATAITVYERIVQREGGSTPQGGMASEQITSLRRRIGQLN
jgi:TolA-binding protein